VFIEACESWDRDSINGPDLLTHLFRACFSGEDVKTPWLRLAQVCVDRANAQGKPAREGLLHAWRLFEHHVLLKSVDWFGVEEYDDEGTQITLDAVLEVRDAVTDLLIQDFVALHQKGDGEALRVYGDTHDAPSYGEHWEFIDSRRELKIKDGKRLIQLLDQDTGDWLDEIKKIMDAPCLIMVRTEHGIVAQAEYAAREIPQ
jgi:hypothetical protein